VNLIMKKKNKPRFVLKGGEWGGVLLRGGGGRGGGGGGGLLHKGRLLERGV